MNQRLCCVVSPTQTISSVSITFKPAQSANVIVKKYLCNEQTHLP